MKEINETSKTNLKGIKPSQNHGIEFLPKRDRIRDETRRLLKKSRKENLQQPPAI
jgi:hypothetical protein